MKNVSSVISKALRSTGQALDGLGRQLELNPNIDKLQPSTRVVKLGKKVPQVTNVFISSSATVVGDVKVGANSSVWYGAVIRGDVNKITIGEGVTIGDRSMIHCSGESSGNCVTKVGNNVVIGSGSIVHGSTIGDNVLIGEGTQLLDGVTIGSNAILAPGSFLSAGKSVPAGQLWSGSPAKYERDLLNEEIEMISKTAAENIEVAQMHALETAKDWETIQDEEYDYQQKVGRNSDYYRRLTPEECAEREGMVEGHAVPGRIFDSPVSGYVMPDSRPDDETPKK